MTSIDNQTAHSTPITIVTLDECQESCMENNITQAKKLLSEIHPPEEFDALSERLIDYASDITPKIESYNTMIENYRKQKRKLDDQISDAKNELRPLTNTRDDLLMYAKRAERKKWDMVREMKARKL